MSASRGIADTVVRLALVAGLAGFGGAAAAADDELPDIEFLEYLGSWEESDEEWLLFDAEVSTAAAAEDGQKKGREEDEVSAGKDSTELDNES